MKTVVENEFIVPFKGRFSVRKAPTAPPSGAPVNAAAEQLLRKEVAKLNDLQRCFFATKKYSLLLVFQALDAAGKDSTIRHVLTGVNPAGCHVTSFRAPSTIEAQHDFLWRTSQVLPKRGMMGVFNRSYYEEVLAVRVNPHFLEAQQLPYKKFSRSFWEERFESIRDHEKHLARQGTIILKFWLNVSKDEQRERLIARIDRERKNWKFEMSDLDTRAQWQQYMSAYEDALRETSREYAPWYAIPADNKPFMRLAVARTIVATLKKLKLRYPEMSAEARQALQVARQQLIEGDIEAD